MPRKVRPEQLGWGLTADLAVTASGNYFIIDSDSGNVTLDFKDVEGDRFQISTQGKSIFQVVDDGTVNIGNNLIVTGSLTVGGIVISGSTLSGSAQFAQTASHLEEKSVSYYNPINTPLFITGGFYRSSSGDWFVS